MCVILKKECQLEIEVVTTECAKCNVDHGYCDAKNTYSNVCGFEPCPSGTFSDEYGKSSIASCHPCPGCISCYLQLLL